MTQRYHNLDALRAFAMLLGIFLHGMMSFMSVPAWAAQDTQQNTPFYGAIMGAIHGFRMPLFFLLSGFFTAMMWRKRGAKGLLKHRAKRIALPLVIFTVLVWPALIAVAIWGVSSRADRGPSGPNMEIWEAAKFGDVEAIDRAIDKGIYIDEPDGLKSTALAYAAMHNQAEAIDHLVEQGADVGRANGLGMTPLYFAAMFGRAEAVKRLVAHGADPNRASLRGATPLDASKIDVGMVTMTAGTFGVSIDPESFKLGQEAVQSFLTKLTVEPGPEYNANWADLKALYVVFSLEVPVFVHLWFLYYLLWMLVLFFVALALRKLVRLAIPDWVTRTPTCLLWLVPATFLAQYFMTQSFGPDTAPGILPWPPKLAYYGIFFLFGAVAFGRKSFEQNNGRRWPWLFVLALPFYLCGMYFYRHSGLEGARVITSACAATYCWLMIFAFIGTFRRFFSVEHRGIRYLSDASYWLYIAHIPLIMVPQILVSEWPTHHFLKAVLVCLLTLAVLLPAYALCVRYTFIGRLLNGKRTRPCRA